jgi:hypothetical protein
MTLTNIGDVANRLGRPKEAHQLLDEASTIYKDLTPKLRKYDRFEHDRAENERVREEVRKHLDGKS